MVKIFIDEQPVEVEEGTTVLEAAEQAGIPIPHFCYHPAFPPEGSCRMCVVEIEGLPKLELACSTQVKEGMKVSTQSEKVIQARKGVLEFLLAEHPMDCPICDKAGECKLQDYYEQYGLFESQFDEYKEKRDKKVKIGKNLILDQERCILCTRCVRFLREMTKTQELGIFNRGVRSVVDIYEDAPVDNNYTGNLAEICPVGAITDSDFRFKTRTWFLNQGESICPLCSRGCNIFVEYHGGFPRFSLPKRVYRIKPRENHHVNGFWICDRGRYGYPYIDQNRLDQITVSNSAPSENLTWENIIPLISQRLKRLYHMKRGSRIALILNTCLSNEELFLIHKIFHVDQNVEKIFFADPPDEAEDGFLLTPERTPNKKGAKEIGFDYKPVDLEALAHGTQFLMVFGSHLSHQHGLAEVKSSLDKIETKILFTSHANQWNDIFDMVLPTALIPEKEGSLTNFQGKIQSFPLALEPLGKSQPEWKIMVDLAKNLGLNFKYYRQFTSPQAVMQAMRGEIGFFGKTK
ncbi:MAG: 2Fe-2S iron-sulfur cluster-binding protein [Candidatus Aminicenantes bacterium]